MICSTRDERNLTDIEALVKHQIPRGGEESLYLSLKQPQPQVSPRQKRSQSAPPARANPSLQRPKLRSSKPQKKMRQSKKRPLHPSLATHKMSRLKAVHSKMSVKIRHGQMTTPATTTSAAVSRLALALICQPLLPKALKNVWEKLIHQRINPLPCPFVMNGQGAPIKLFCTLWRPNHVWLFNIRKNRNIAPPLPLKRCDAM